MKARKVDLLDRIASLGASSAARMQNLFLKIDNILSTTDSMIMEIRNNCRARIQLLDSQVRVGLNHLIFSLNVRFEKLENACISAIGGYCAVYDLPPFDPAVKTLRERVAAFSASPGRAPVAAVAGVRWVWLDLASPHP